MVHGMHAKHQVDTLILEREGIGRTYLEMYSFL